MVLGGPGLGFRVLFLGLGSLGFCSLELWLLYWVLGLGGFGFQVLGFTQVLTINDLVT